MSAIAVIDQRGVEGRREHVRGDQAQRNLEGVRVLESHSLGNADILADVELQEEWRIAPDASRLDDERAAPSQRPTEVPAFDSSRSAGRGRSPR